MWRFLAFLATASALSAQFSQFAVSDDGRLYFSTELHTGTEGPRYKIYKITGEGLSLFASLGPTDDPFGSMIASPLVSGDGSITGYAVHHPCRTGSCGMFALPRTFYTVERAGLANYAAENLEITRNGRFLLATVLLGPNLRLNLGRRIELPSGAQRDFPEFGPPASTRQAIASDGTILFLGYGTETRLALVPYEGPARFVAGTAGAVLGILSPDGSRMAYVRAAGAGFALVLTDAQGAVHRVLAQSSEPGAFQPSFANDGALLYLETDGKGVRQPVFLAAGGEPARLMAVESGVTQAIVSGSGQLAWLGTGEGQILRVRTADGVADEIIPATPYTRLTFLSALPGSVVRLTGSGLTAAARYRLEGFELPFSEATPEGAAVQIPWEYAAAGPAPPVGTVGPPRAFSLSGSSSPFLQTLRFYPLPLPTVTFERTRFGQLQAAHQDFRGLVTAEDPARPGETIHVFARNMGAVDRPVVTGRPSPSDPPARITASVGCYLYPSINEYTQGAAVGLAVPFAGLAGGAIGIYQIDVTIPENWAAPLSLLECRDHSGDGLYRGDSGHIRVAISQ